MAAEERIGLYEELLTARLKTQLQGLVLTIAAEKDGFDEAKLRDLLEAACAKAIHEALTAILLLEGAKAADRAARIDSALSLVNALLKASAGFGRTIDVLETPPQVLLAADEPAEPAAGAGAGEPFAALSSARPLTKFSGTSLLTGEANEVRLQSELYREIQSAERIDWLVSFIRDSGVKKLLPALSAFAARGGRIRVLTTTYTGATQLDAVLRLARLPNAQVRIAYSHQRAPMHAKAYLFSRPHGLSTAYVGSANLSETAQTRGLEWTMKLTESAQPEILAEMSMTFDDYFENDALFTPFDPEDPQSIEAFLASQREQKRRYAPGGGEAAGLGRALPVVNLRPYPYQQALLDKIASARTLRGEVRSLVVAATGTGKTMIAAFDYRAWRRTHPSSRLLFVAHRAEILEQALGTFRLVLGDANFGSRLDGLNALTADADCDHLFVSVQTAARRGIEAIAGSPERFDFVVIDEFHHAAADTYQSLLTYLKPKAMLGLTATPNRADGQSIFKYFERHAATAELPLATAIDNGLLSPFEYWMVADPVSLETAAWRNGGYDVGELEARYTEGPQAKARDLAILSAAARYLPQYAPLRAIGFCASMKHAQHMAEVFAQAGYRAGLVLGTTPAREREETLRRLRAGELQFVFAVDVFNEGVDIPEVNAVLFLRPTDSAVVFLQQLGRGLRLAEGKDALTVLDFAANANKKFSYEARLRALMLSKNGGSVREMLSDPMSEWLPRGCSLQFERLAREAVLKNLREYRETDDELIGRVRAWLDRLGPAPSLEVVSLARFLSDEGLALSDWIKRAARRGFSFSALLHRAQPDRWPKPSETLSSQSAAGYVRVLRFNAFRTIGRLLGLLRRRDFPSGQAAGAAFERLSKEDRLALTALGWHWWSGNDITSMTVDDPSAPGGRRPMTGEASEVARRLFERLGEDPLMRREIVWLLEAAAAGVDFASPESPNGRLERAFGLELHADYAMKAVGALLGDNAPRKMMSGVAYLKAIGTDCFFVTIRKDEKTYKAKVRYDDYAVNDGEFHWESQAATSHAGAVGRRYQQIDFRNPAAPQGLLFVREVKEDDFGTSPFTFLGRVRYVRSWGDKPMSIVWALQTKLPARLLERFQK